MTHAVVGPAPLRITWHQISAWLGPTDRAAIGGCAALAFALAILAQGWAQAAVFAMMGGLVAAITLIDQRHFRIPDLLSLPLIPLGVIDTALALAPVMPRLLVMGLVWGLLTLLQRGFMALRGRSGLGSGDVKLMAAAAVWLDPNLVPVYVLAAAVTALFEGLFRRAGPKGRIAFGAHLAPWLMVFALAA